MYREWKPWEQFTGAVPGALELPGQRLFQPTDHVPTKPCHVLLAGLRGNHDEGGATGTTGGQRGTMTTPHLTERWLTFGKKTSRLSTTNTTFVLLPCSRTHLNNI